MEAATKDDIKAASRTATKSKTATLHASGAVTRAATQRIVRQILGLRRSLKELSSDVKGMPRILTKKT